MTNELSQTFKARDYAAVLVRGSLEVLVLAIVCLSPWVLGSVEPGAECCLYCGVAVLLLLWAIHSLLEGALTWNRCPVSLGLAGLFLFGIFQLIPWPTSVLPYLSPETARLTHELLPTTPEVLPGGEAPAVSTPAGATLSLHPAETRFALVRLLAVLILFAVVRNNLGSVAALRRLSLAVLVNGLLLALFAVVQFLSSPRQMVYWTIPVGNAPFGPFICKNHFPFYLNLCIGLGAGLLFSLRRLDDRAMLNLRGLLHHPAALWSACALAFMIGSVALSLSRGGLLSLAASALVWLLLRFWQTRRVSRLETGLLIGAIALVLVVCFGLEPLQARLATVWSGDALEDTRLPLWADALAIVRRFPLWGTGYSSFLYVELTYRTRTDSLAFGWDNAHNDYLEALVEGGVVRLLLSLAIIVLVYRLSWRALRRSKGHAAPALVGGAVFAFTTVVIHSFVDFGLHIPAIAVLAAVVAAQLSALGAAPEDETNRLRFGGFAPVVGLLAALVLGWILCGEGWRLARTYSLEVAARALEDKTEPAQRERRLAMLDAAARSAPDSAHIHLVAGQAYLDVYQAELDDLGNRDSEAERGRLARRYLTPALRHYLQARDLCPLIAKPHMQIAAHVGWLERADSRADYLRRAKEACPSHPEIWYLAGVLELADKHRDQAWASWRRSLELSPEFLVPILNRGRKHLDDEALVECVLPARADRLLAAADYLHPEGDRRERRPYLRRARSLLENPLVPADAATLHLRGRVEAELGDAAAALASYEAALEREPLQTGWRVEYATLLHQHGRDADARHELRLVLGQQPDNAAAKRLLEKVARALTEGN